MDNLTDKKCDIISDEELVAKVNAGCNEALRLLFSRYTGIVRKFAAEFSLDNDIEDLVQEGLIALYSATKVYDSSMSSFSTFASVCIKRSMLSVLKKQYRKKQVPADMLVYVNDRSDNSDRKSDELITDNTTPELLLIEKEDAACLSARVKAKLSDFEFKVLVTYLACYSYSDIAGILSVSEKSVNNAMCRVRQKLKDLN